MEAMKARAYIQMLTLLLAGCVGGGGDGYPSLARRPVESLQEATVVAPADEAIPAHPDLVSVGEGLVQNALKSCSISSSNVLVANMKASEVDGPTVSED